jgi:hypothetical protein
MGSDKWNFILKFWKSQIKIILNYLAQSKKKKQINLFKKVLVT